MEVLSMLKHSLVADGMNPITRCYELKQQTASAGPEMAWKVYDAVRLEDNKEVSVFVFDKKIAEKLHKPKRRETIADLLRTEVKTMVRFRHPHILKVLHPLEECHNSLAFATEPVLGSLANLLGNYDRMPTVVPPAIKEHTFLESEISYGILQVGEALSYLHSSEHTLHGNVNPQSVVITKRGTWKMAGFGFAQTAVNGKDSYPCQAWSMKSPKMAQPDLGYVAPEIQFESVKYCTVLSDMFSFGMLICAVFNGGRSLLQANHNVSTYAKMSEQLTESFSAVAHKMPLQLVEPVEKMINKDIRYRPTAQNFVMLRYFDDPVVRCMQEIVAIDCKDLAQKCDFFSRLATAIAQFPMKVLFGCVMPVLFDQLETAEMLPLILPSMLNVVELISKDDYRARIQAPFRKVFNMVRPVQATIYLLQKLDVIMEKATEEEIKTDVLPMIFNALESNSIQSQEAAISVFSTIKQYLDDRTMRKLVLPKAKSIFLKSDNVRTRLNALACVDRLIDSLDKMMILDEVLPFLTEITCQDVDIIMSVIGIYKHLLSDRKFGLTHNLLATKVMPALIPHTVSPGLKLEQFGTLMEVLREMLEQIYRQRRNKMLDETPDGESIELRSRLQQMYYLATRASAIKLPEEYLAMARMGKRSSFESNSSAGSSYSVGRQSPRRTSIDMRYNVFDPPRSESIFSSKYMLSVEEAYSANCKRGVYNRFGRRQAPSTPELQTKKTPSQDSLGPKAYKRHSSFQGLGCEEQAVLEKIVRARRASLAPGAACGRQTTPFTHHGPPGGAANPHILVSEPSVGDFDEPLFFFGANGTVETRRSSTQSMGPVAVPEYGRRDSRGRPLDLIDLGPRRSSFQGMCDTAMQFFTGK